MANPLSSVLHLNVDQLAAVIKNRIDKVLIIDSRSFLEFNTCHILNAVNVCCSKIVKRRLQQDKMSVKDFLTHTCQIEADESFDVIVYDQSSMDALALSADSFIYVLLKKLAEVFKSVSLLHGGFLEFQAFHPSLCEDKTRKYAPMTSLSQPCLSLSNQGPTRILPFLYLGSQCDAMNKELLSDHNITYELNVSANCPKPDFIQDHQFMRISVNDSYSDKLLPHFSKAFNFLDKVQEANGCVLVHCLAGISRSPTVAIAYVMRHLRMTSDEAYRYVKSKRATISPNFNFLGQLLEYERQLQAENLLSGASEALTAPPFVNGHKRQCCTDMRSSRKLTLNLPLTTLTCGLQAVGTSVLSRTGDQSPTTGLAKLSFHTPEKEKEVSFADDIHNFEKSGLTGITRSRECMQSRCVKTTQITFMSAVKEETLLSSSSSSCSVIQTSRLDGTSKTESSSEVHLYKNEGKLSYRGPFLSKLNVSPYRPSTSQERTPDKEGVESNTDTFSLSPQVCEKRQFLSTLHYPSGLLDSAVGPTLSRCSSATSMPSHWSTFVESNPREYNRSDSNSTSGLGSEICSEVSDLDSAMEVQSMGDSCGSDSKLSPLPKHEMVVDNESVVLRKPLTLLQGRETSAERTSGAKTFESLMSKTSRDSGNPLSPVETLQTEGSVSEASAMFGFWEKTGRGSNCKSSHDSGIVSSPTWSSSNEGSSSKYVREDYFAASKAAFFCQGEKTVEKNSGKCFTKSTNITAVERGSSVSQASTSLMTNTSVSLGKTVRENEQKQKPDSKKEQFNKSVLQMTSSVSSATKKDDGLYRAQSCPGIVGRIQCATPPNSALLTSGPRIRNLNFTSVDRAVKFRNRYSCGSLDYGDLERIIFDSCPDFGNFGRCQSSGAIATIADRTPVTPTHRTFSRNLSIIQVS